MIISYKKYFHFWGQDVQQQTLVSVAEVKFNMESKHILFFSYMEYCIRKWTQNTLTCKSLMAVLKGKENSLRGVKKRPFSKQWFSKAHLSKRGPNHEFQFTYTSGTAKFGMCRTKSLFRDLLDVFPPQKWWKQESRWESSHFGTGVFYWDKE